MTNVSVKRRVLRARPNHRLRGTDCVQLETLLFIICGRVKLIVETEATVEYRLLRGICEMSPADGTCIQVVLCVDDLAYIACKLCHS